MQTNRHVFFKSSHNSKIKTLTNDNEVNKVLEKERIENKILEIGRNMYWRSRDNRERGNKKLIY